MSKEHTEGQNPRAVALHVLERVRESSSYANLTLPAALEEAELHGQEAGFATDLVYGTLRWQGLLDSIISAAAKRPLEKIDETALTILRLGTYQLLFMAVPDYAAVSSTVTLAKGSGRAYLSGFINAVIRKISQRDRKEWESLVTSRLPKEPASTRLTVRYSHPAWIVNELTQALVAAGRTASDIAHLLEADNSSAHVTLVARPGLIGVEDLIRQLPDQAQVEPGRWSPYALRVKGAHPGSLKAVKHGVAGVEDEGSQLAALALASAVLDDARVTAETRWLDMCAGPGGKTALLGALAAQRHVTVTANEPSPHRAELVRENIQGLRTGSVDEVLERDGRDFGALMPDTFNRILVDAPCTGLGALRRRPEARWTKKPEDITQLAQIQKGLLDSALAAVKPGGCVAYVTCSPVIAETRDIVDAALAAHSTCERLDAAEVIRSIAPGIEVGKSGDVQLFTDTHDTDMMFISLIRRNQ